VIVRRDQKIRLIIEIDEDDARAVLSMLRHPKGINNSTSDWLADNIEAVLPQGDL